MAILGRTSGLPTSEYRSPKPKPDRLGAWRQKFPTLARIILIVPVWEPLDHHATALSRCQYFRNSKPFYPQSTHRHRRVLWCVSETFFKSSGEILNLRLGLRYGGKTMKKAGGRSPEKCIPLLGRHRETLTSVALPSVALKLANMVPYPSQHTRTAVKESAPPQEKSRPPCPFPSILKQAVIVNRCLKRSSFPRPYLLYLKLIQDRNYPRTFDSIPQLYLIIIPVIQKVNTATYQVPLKIIVLEILENLSIPFDCNASVLTLHRRPTGKMTVEF